MRRVVLYSGNLLALAVAIILLVVTACVPGLPQLSPTPTPTPVSSPVDPGWTPPPIAASNLQQDLSAIVA